MGITRMGIRGKSRDILEVSGLRFEFEEEFCADDGAGAYFVAWTALIE
jgi:hypothetical protein